MDWQGCARTNYVRVENLEGLEASLEPFDIKVYPHPKGEDYYMLSSTEADGGWPTWVAADEDAEDAIDIEFSFEEHVMPFIAEGEALIVQDGGGGRFRYAARFAGAYVRDGDRVLSESVTIDDIYKLAAEKLGISDDRLVLHEYSAIPGPGGNASPSRPKF